MRFYGVREWERVEVGSHYGSEQQNQLTCGWVNGCMCVYIYFIYTYIYVYGYRLLRNLLYDEDIHRIAE